MLIYSNLELVSDLRQKPTTYQPSRVKLHFHNGTILQSIVSPATAGHSNFYRELMECLPAVGRQKLVPTDSVSFCRNDNALLGLASALLADLGLK